LEKFINPFLLTYRKNEVVPINPALNAKVKKRGTFNVFIW